MPVTIASAMTRQHAVVVRVAHLVAARRDGRGGAPLGLVPAARVQAQAEAGARRAVACGLNRSLGRSSV